MIGDADAGQPGDTRANGPIGVSILGSTGSIGISTLDVLRRHSSRFRVVALAAHRNVERLVAQAVEFRPDYVAIADASLAPSLAAQLVAAGVAARVVAGAESLQQVATLPEAAYVMAAIVGAAGLPSTLAAAGAGKRLLIANKEALVMAGPLVLAAAARAGSTIIPIDSEHNAIFQCLPAGTELGLPPRGVRRILLTASGGPFRDWSAADLQHATPEQACAHPTWNMGRKISVDSATLMNKGPCRPSAWKLSYTGRAWCIHWSNTSMDRCWPSWVRRTCAPPIAQALAWPERLSAGVQFLDLLQVARLISRRRTRSAFPASGSRWMRHAKAANCLPCSSAANEEAVAELSLMAACTSAASRQTCAK